MSASNFFVGVGAQKAGTSWLWDYLTSHPTVAASPIKELHYFDSKYTAVQAGEIRSSSRLRKHLLACHAFARKRPVAAARKLRHLAALWAYQDRTYREFLAAGAQGELAGEITPSYFALEADGFRALEKALPEPRYIVMLRNPVDRFWSQVRYRGRWSGDLDSADLVSLLDQDVYRLKSDYARFFAAIEAVVPKDRLHVIFYEHLFDPQQTQRECDRLCAFLSIAPHAADSERIANLGDYVPEDRLDRPACLMRLADSYRALSERYGSHLPASWKRDLAQLEELSVAA